MTDDAPAPVPLWSKAGSRAHVVFEEAEDSNFPPLAVTASCKSQPKGEFHKTESHNSKMMHIQL